MIHIFIGTKAQYVKTAPVIKELDSRGIGYNLIDSGQHAQISQKYRKFFDIKDPDVYLSQSKEDIKTVSAMISWFFSFLFRIIFNPKYIAETLFKGKKGVCLIHGDTPTTLLSALAAKRVGIKVAHLESGLRSFNLFQPFPEEIIRIITMRIADILYAPNQWSLDNLIKMKVKGEQYLVDGNTNIDVLRLAIKSDFSLPNGLTKHNFVVFSIHRVETILNRNRLTQIVSLAQKISEQTPVLFCMHPPTKKQLKKWKLIDKLTNNPNIYENDLLDYPIFINTITQSKFIVTDGGSIQEESYFLNIPCLVMRQCTERIEGLNENVCIANFDDKVIEDFIENSAKYRNSTYTDSDQYPSKGIVEHLISKNFH